MVHFGKFLKNLKPAVKQCYQTGQKLMENAKIQMPHFELIRVEQTRFKRNEHRVCETSI